MSIKFISEDEIIAKTHNWIERIKDIQFICSNCKILARISAGGFFITSEYHTRPYSYRLSCSELLALDILK
jgi:hypothetical protein